MSKESDRVIAGFMRLSTPDQQTVISAINEYMREHNTQRKRILKENYEVKAGVVLGPLDQGGCPCCGK